MKDIKSKPHISENSNKIIKAMKKQNRIIKNSFQRLTDNSKAKKSISNREKIKEEMEMQGFTGKPEINKKSNAMFNDVSKLIQWDIKKAEKEENIINRIVFI